MSWRVAGCGASSAALRSSCGSAGQARLLLLHCPASSAQRFSLGLSRRLPQDQPRVTGCISSRGQTSALSFPPESPRRERTEGFLSSPIDGSSWRRLSTTVRAAAGDATADAAAEGSAKQQQQQATSSKDASGPFAAIVAFLRGLFEQSVLTPLGNFGFGKRSIWEGGVGLFLMTGILVAAVVVGWVKGVRLQSRTRRYQAVFEFSQACGIAVGTPVRIRGVDVGSVVGVRPSLEKIDAVVEVLDDRVVIPRNALIEVNQSGLISETLIDVTPRPPMPEPQYAPTDPRCSEEGLIVCDRERVAGQQGVSLDELVGVCTKLAKEMDREGGMQAMFDALDKFAALAQEAQPLVQKVNAMAGDLRPLLADLKDGELLENLEKLTKVASEVAHDLRQLNGAILTDDNTALLRQSVKTLTRTLQHVEQICADVSGLTGDATTRHNLKQLIESLSRIVVD